MAVDLYVADEQHERPVDVDRFARLAKDVLVAQGVRGDAEMSLLFVDETTIAALNAQFLGKEGPTDVLSFPIEDEVPVSGRVPDVGGTGPGSEPPEGPDVLLVGDVVICPAVAARNAADHGVPVEDEMALLVVHGILHLLGMDHAEDAEAEAMEARERELLARFHRAP